LTSAPATFQRFMNEKFMKVLGKSVVLYLDDILVFSDSREEHEQHVREVLEILCENDIQADIKKCEFYTQSVKYLGLIVTPEGIRMDSSRVRAIQEWPVPKLGDLRAVRKFLGFVNFYRRFCLGFSKTARPLNDLLRKDASRVWDERCTKAFEELKRLVEQEPVLVHFDSARETFVECDASDHTVGGVLSQRMDDGELHPVAYFSTSMAPAERNYAIYDKELLAIIRCFEE
jgi:hypothetical protein